MRIKSKISPNTNSATERVLENGALNTGIPRIFAALRSTWLVPIQKQPIAISLGAASIISAVNWVRERKPIKCASLIASFSSLPSKAFL